MIADCLMPPPAAMIAPLGAGVLRSLKVEFHPICDGRELISPNGHFLARATSTYGPRWLGGHYEFVVEDRAGTRLQYVEVPVSRDALINWRLEGSVHWADDSSSVTFEFGRQRLTLPIDRFD